MQILATTAIGALMYLIVTMFVPFVGGSVEGAMPDWPAYDDMNVTGTGNVTHYPSGWNPEYNTDLPQASTTWVSINGFLTIAAIFAVMALVFMFLRGMI
jgi:hypothetical protein